MKLAMVILHYETIEDTKKCLASLIKTNKDSNFDVVIVDNGSTYGKIDTLKSEFSADNIHYLVSEKNLGFAKGNNLGFVYAKKELNSELIILANNDLVFEQEGFLKEICAIHEREHFDVAGPRIISLVDGKNQNPVRINFKNVGDVKKRRIKFQILLMLNYLGIDKIVKRGISKGIEEYYPDNGEGYQLHGACLIFGKNFIEKYDGLFSGTFMYAEEDFLLRRVIKDGLKMQYIDSLTVRHKEGSSTNKAMKKPIKGRRFFYRWSIKSLKLLEQYMNGKIEEEYAQRKN